MDETKKPDNWQIAASIIGKTIRDLYKKHPEVEPLVSSWINFSRKYGVVDCAAQDGGMMIVSKTELLRMHKQISRQTIEIEALEYRIKTLLERP